MNLFFDQKGMYWVQLHGANYIPLGKEDIRLHAIRNGVREASETNLTAIESLFYRAQMFRSVTYAGPLAGHRAGPFERSSGQRILVSDECNAFKRKPAKGKRFKFIEGYLDALFESGHDHVIGWLSCGLRSLLRGDFAPGQLLALCGPPGVGKSFFHYLVTELLGGRMAKPYSYMVGRTNHNGDLARAESLVIEDEVASTDIRTRRNFGAMLKQMCVAEEQHTNDKGKIAYTAPLFHRVHMSLNDEAESLMILPPLDGDLHDKVIIVRCKDATGALHESREENKRAIQEELPAFHAYLVAYRVPQALRSQRYGVTHFHDPILMARLSETKSETVLLTLIDEVVFHPGNKHDGEWTGTANELRMELQSAPGNPVPSGLFYYPTATGVYLSRLANSHPERIWQTKSKGRVVWHIKEAA
jgi:hypothetical protein